MLHAAIAHDAVLIPFGGGTSISGSLEAEPDEERPVVSVDMTRLDRVLAIDPTSRTARVQAGVFGPALEEQLGRQGWTFAVHRTDRPATEALLRLATLLADGGSPATDR